MEQTTNNKYQINFEGFRKLVRDRTISISARLLATDILLYAGKDGQSFPNEETLASNLGFNYSRQVRNLLRELKRQGILSWRRGGFGKSNRYSINKEIYFRIDDTKRKPISSQSGNTVPIQTGNTVPTKVSHERTHVSSKTLQLLQKALKKEPTKPELNRVEQLCLQYDDEFVQDAINEAISKNLPFIKIGLISNILGDWKQTGKPPPKPIFKPCGKDGCENGSIFNPDHKTFTPCDCSIRYKEARAVWEKDWG